MQVIERNQNNQDDTRIGAFELDPDFLASGVPAVRAIFASCFIIQARNCETCDATHYLAWSPLFDKMPLNDAMVQAPEYRFQFSIHPVLGQLSIKAVRS